MCRWAETFSAWTSFHTNLLNKPQKQLYSMIRRLDI
jgi:hypothetical protein